MLLSQLEYFRVVAKYEHVSRAAEELRIAQPALSSVLRKLEQELGVPLFDRTGRSIKLNDAGQRLLKHIDSLFAQMDSMQASLEQTKEIIENKVTISVSNSMFLAGWLHNFVLANPKIRLHQRMLGEEQMAEALLDESVDVIIGHFAKDMPGIVRKVLVEDGYVFTVQKNHPLGLKSDIVFDDIRNADIITLPSNSTAKIAEHVFAGQNCQPKIIFEGSHRMMAQLGVQGRGLSFATRQMIYVMMLSQRQLHPDGRLYDDEDQVIIRTISDIDCSCNLCMCWKAGRELPVMARKFIEALDATYPRYCDDAAFMQRHGEDWKQEVCTK